MGRKPAKKAKKKPVNKIAVKKKKKAKRKPVLKKSKPVRSKDNPVKIVFQCELGFGTSGFMSGVFESYLEKKGLNDLFKIETAGGRYSELKDTSLRWLKQLKEADLVVTFVPVQDAEFQVKRHKNIIVGRSIEYSSEGKRKLFGRIIKMMQDKFILKK